MTSICGRSALGICLLALAAGWMQAQAGGQAQVMVSSGRLQAEGTSSLGAAGGELYREIDDPNLGDRWLLERNAQVPGGPGRLVRAGTAWSAPGQITAPAAALPVIRPGDRIVVEEHTAVVDAVLEARALRPAAVGGIFEARLAIGGRVVRVVALGAGRAAFAPPTEARP